MVGSQELGGIFSLSIQLITVLHRIMFPTPRGDFGAVLEVCGRMGVQQHAWLGQAIGWHFWCVRRWGFTSQSRSFLWFLGKPRNHNMVLNFLRTISHPVFSLFFGDLVFRHFQTKANSWLILGQVRLAGWQGL